MSARDGAAAEWRPEDFDTVDQATRLIVEALPARLGLTGAAMAMGLSARVLEAAFVRSGLNPRVHIRRVRLKRLRAVLRTGGSSTLDQALAQLGFPPGNPDVAKDYRRLFGLTPREEFAAADGSAEVGPKQVWAAAERLKGMVDATGIEPVTPTMST